jgi:hypothetical protein
MKRYIIALLLLLPVVAHAEIPAIAKLGKEASKHTDVEHMSVGSFMLGMASTFADKEQRATYKMLNNIELIECHNNTYAPHLIKQTLAIIANVGAEYIANEDDGKALNSVYGIRNGEIFNELIIIVEGKTGGVMVVAMSGDIPTSRLGEIARIKR